MKAQVQTGRFCLQGLKDGMNNQLVSVIISTHNHDLKIVLRAIDSVLRQTYNNIEIIVVDDSEDSFQQRKEVEKAVREASDKIKYIKLDKNRGACVARNTGLKISKGYYVAFLDDDDEWLPNKIEEQLKGFQESTVALTYGGIIVIDEINGRRYKGSSIFISGNIFHRLLYSNIIGTTSNPLIKADCIKEVGGFDELMQSSQDYDLWLRIAKRYRVHYIDKPLINYHIHSGTRISTDVDKKISGLERINMKYAEYINAENELWHRRHIVLVPYYLIKFGRIKALSLWAKCVRSCPTKIEENSKCFILILLGYRYYSALSECFNNFTRRKYDDKYDE